MLGMWDKGTKCGDSGLRADFGLISGGLEETRTGFV